MAERLKQDPRCMCRRIPCCRCASPGPRRRSCPSTSRPTTAEPSPEVEGFKPQVKTADGLFQADVTLTRPAIIKVTDDGKELGSWRISLIPDAPPTVEITDVTRRAIPPAC